MGNQKRGSIDVWKQIQRCVEFAISGGMDCLRCILVTFDVVILLMVCVGCGVSRRGIRSLNYFAFGSVGPIAALLKSIESAHKWPVDG